ncbi:MAG: acyl-CoA dehydrogenase domain-containing protein, partial [Casimicrobiaceae bacterium]
SMLYLCSATLKRYEDEGRQAADAPLMHWAIWEAMFRAQNAIEGVISNFPNRLISVLLRAMVFPLGRPYVVPSDKLGHEVARLLIEPSATRDRLTAGMYLPRDEGDALGSIELALAAALAAEPIEARVREAVKAGRLAAAAASAPDAAPDAAAVAAGVISADELAILRRAAELADRVIRVDDFAQDLGAAELKPPAAAAKPPAAGRKTAAA